MIKIKKANRFEVGDTISMQAKVVCIDERDDSIEIKVAGNPLLCRIWVPQSCCTLVEKSEQEEVQRQVMKRHFNWELLRIYIAVAFCFVGFLIGIASLSVKIPNSADIKLMESYKTTAISIDGNLHFKTVDGKAGSFLFKMIGDPDFENGFVIRTPVELSGINKFFIAIGTSLSIMLPIFLLFYTIDSPVNSKRWAYY